jgi:hypothetical protein
MTLVVYFPWIRNFHVYSTPNVTQNIRDNYPTLPHITVTHPRTFHTHSMYATIPPSCSQGDICLYLRYLELSAVLGTKRKRNPIAAHGSEFTENVRIVTGDVHSRATIMMHQFERPARSRPAGVMS